MRELFFIAMLAIGCIGLGANFGFWIGVAILLGCYLLSIPISFILHLLGISLEFKAEYKIESD